MWYKTKAPTNPSRPSALSDPKIAIILSTTDILFQKGIPTPPNNTSNTTLSNNATIDGFTVTCNTANGQEGGCGAFFTYDKAVEAAHDCVRPEAGR